MDSVFQKFIKLCHHLFFVWLLLVVFLFVFRFTNFTLFAHFIRNVGRKFYNAFSTHQLDQDIPLPLFTFAKIFTVLVIIFIVSIYYHSYYGAIS